MKKNILNAFALILLSAHGLYAGNVPVPQKATPVLDCPQASEKPEDCPWAGVARLLDAKAGGKEDLAPIFASYAPGILKQLDADRSNTAALSLWGESINYDEMANGIIVNNEILGFISARLGVAQPKGKIVHAGMEHTYGYLFSLLSTKFGFKRARWVRPDIEEGLGLPRGSAGPAPSEGTLLANVSCLAGGIALKDDKKASALLKRAKPFCAPALRDYAVPGHDRLTEEVSLPGGRKVALRTDFVPFVKNSGGNDYLLVYSVHDSAAKRAFLITAFPVNKGFVENALSPAGLGEDKPVQTRYNAHVEGFTGVGSFKGKRSVAVVGK